MTTYLFTLYITGQSPRSRRAIANLRQICEAHLPQRHEINVVDLLEDPQRAEDEKIQVTPLLVKEQPQPVQRIIGDLSETDDVLLNLDLLPAEKE